MDHTREKTHNDSLFSNKISKVVFALVFLCIGGVFGYVYHCYFGGEDSSSDTSVFRSEKVISVEKVIQKEYYKFEEKSKEEIENGVIESMVGSLGDKHSSYFSPSEAKEFSEVLRGDFEGIGAVIDSHNRGIIIRKIIQDSPAKRAGLLDGDIIVQVDDASMLGLSAEEAVKLIRGPKGSKVKLMYSRGDEITAKTVEVTRDTINIPSTYEYMLTGGLSDVGYIEVSFFGEKTQEEFLASLEKLTASGAKGLILDFRNNGGGYLDTAVDILSLFLSDDTLAVTTRENNPRKTFEMYTRSTESTDTNIPLVMMVNGLSASATEIVAGALQDYDRAILVGEKTYGKGSVQEPFVLSDGSIIKLTIGRWYTPKDQNIDKNGITPEVMIPIFERDFSNRYDRQMEAAKKLIDNMLSTNQSKSDIIRTFNSEEFSQ